MQEDIDQILLRAAVTLRDDQNLTGGTFAKASFSSSNAEVVGQNGVAVDLSDPNFWEKTGLAQAPVEEDFAPRQRRQVKRLGINELSDEEGEDEEVEIDTATGKVRPSAKTGGWTRKERMAFKDGLMLFGFGRWEKIREYKLEHRSIEEIHSFAQGFIYQTSKIVPESEELSEFAFMCEELLAMDADTCKEGDLSKLRTATGDWAAEDESQERRHKLIAANKARKFHVDPALATPEGIEKIRKDAPIILARLQMLFALQKVVAEASNPLVSLPIIELPSLPSATWWTHQDDMHLLVGTFRYGYANYEDMRNDPELTFFQKIDPNIKIGASFEEKADQATEEAMDIDAMEERKDEVHESEVHDMDLDAADELCRIASADGVKKEGAADGSSALPKQTFRIDEEGNKRYPFPSPHTVTQRVKRLLDAKRFQRERQRKKEMEERNRDRIEKKNQKDEEKRQKEEEKMRKREEMALEWSKKERSELCKAISLHGIARRPDDRRDPWRLVQQKASLHRKPPDVIRRHYEEIVANYKRVIRMSYSNSLAEPEPMPPMDQHKDGIKDDPAANSVINGQKV